MVKKLILIASIVFLIDRFFKIVLTSVKINTGAAFGVLKGHNTFLILFGVFMILIILYYKNKKNLETGTGFLLGGILSNTLDRLVYGGVLDYIYLKGAGNIFNLADVSNVIGALILGYYFWKE